MLDGIDISLLTNQADLVLKLIIAVILGAIVGYEREISHKPAGLRTHIFVCMGSCLFTIASFYLLPEHVSLLLLMQHGLLQESLPVSALSVREVLLPCEGMPKDCPLQQVSGLSQRFDLWSVLGITYFQPLPLLSPMSSYD